MAHSFILSALVGPGHGVLTLRGDLDTPAATRLGAHLDGFLDAAVLYVTVNATDVTSHHPRVTELIAVAHRRLAARGGGITVHGLHPGTLAAP